MVMTCKFTRRVQIAEVFSIVCGTKETLPKLIYVISGLNAVSKWPPFVVMYIEM